MLARVTSPSAISADGQYDLTEQCSPTLARHGITLAAKSMIGRAMDRTDRPDIQKEELLPHLCLQEPEKVREGGGAYVHA